MTDPTNAARQARYRQRKATEGLTEVRGIYAPPEDHKEIREQAAKIARRRERKEREKK